jgi:ATP/ADP translocase
MLVAIVLLVANVLLRYPTQKEKEKEKKKKKKKKNSRMDTNNESLTMTYLSSLLLLLTLTFIVTKDQISYNVSFIICLYSFKHATHWRMGQTINS